MPVTRSLNAYRWRLLLALIVVLPLGYGTRFFLPTQIEWLRNLLGNIFYEIFWILLAALFAPQLSLTAIALGVCLASCAIEFLQLWQPPFLQAIRATLPGRLVFGNGFTWVELPQYFLGSLIGWFMVRRLQPMQRSHTIR